MGIKSTIVDVAVENVASTRLTTGLGLGTIFMGVINKLGLDGMSVDSFAVLVGALVTLGVGITTIYVKLSENRAKQRLYKLAEMRYKNGGTIPEELLHGIDEEKNSSLL